MYRHAERRRQPVQGMQGGVYLSGLKAPAILIAQSKGRRVQFPQVPGPSHLPKPATEVLEQAFMQVLPIEPMTETPEFGSLGYRRIK